MLFYEKHIFCHDQHRDRTVLIDNNWGANKTTNWEKNKHVLVCLWGTLCAEISECLLNVSGILWHIPTVLHRNNESIGARVNWGYFLIVNHMLLAEVTLCFVLGFMCLAYGVLVNMSLSANPFFLMVWFEIRQRIQGKLGDKCAKERRFTLYTATLVTYYKSAVKERSQGHRIEVFDK